LEGVYSGELALVRGQPLPIVTGQRFWGTRVLVPMGQTLWPPCEESEYLAAAQAQPGELLVVQSESVDAIPANAFTPLTRAGIRQAAPKRIS
jgi:hypothetical protein